jgi:5-methylcytosine-specific restriction endonuclease McrA
MLLDAMVKQGRPFKRTIERGAGGEVVALGCSKCSVVLPVDAFGPDRRNAVGRMSWCNACVGATSKAARERWTAERWAQHNAERAAYCKQWRADNPEMSKAGQQRGTDRYREVHGEAVKATSRLDPRRRHGREIRAAVTEVLGDKCLACGTDQGVEIDHVVPLTVWIDNSPSNLQVLCRGCNVRKREGSIDYRTDEQRAKLAAIEVARGLVDKAKNK